MLKNYFLIALRNLRKHLSYATINIAGLGLGLATCLLLITWILHEVSYDKFHAKADRIYRASLEYGFGGQVARVSVSPTALLPALLNLPEVETGTRVYNPSAWSPYIVKKDDKLFQEKRFYAADSTFFDVFSYRLIKGNVKEALTKPYQVILTEAMAEKYFGDEDALGKTLRINDTRDYVVAGVMENAPTNSLMQFDFVCSFASLRAGREQPIWWSANFQTFVALNENANVAVVEEKINKIATKAVANDLSGPGDYVKYNFTKLTDIYLRSDFNGEPEVTSDIRYIYIFSAVALLILVIACINYINLATARAADRAREVGIRKVVGAVRQQLFAQFIGESILITFTGFIVAFLLAQLTLPFFNDLTGKKFGAAILLQPQFLIGSVVALLVISVLAGAYPAFAITNFKPVSVLKGNFKSSGKGIWLRKSLVVFQFTISVILIVGTLIIVKQLDFIQGKNLGYDRENTIVLPLDNQTSAVFDALRNELVRTNVATYVGRGTESPVNIQGGYSVNKMEDSGPGIITTGLLVDEDYLPAIGVRPMLGRIFTKQDVERVSRDTVYAFVVNESALRALFISNEEAIGKKLRMGDRKGEIVGVVKDFHFTSLHQNIGPLVVFPEEWQFSKVFVRLTPGDVSKKLAGIQKIYSSLVTHRPFEYQFLDEQYAALYKNEQRLGNVFVVFASLAIIIACLGLLGLVSFSASQKIKEIGIRKVLGATASNIVVLITKDFTALVLIAIVIGLPVAYWMMSEWLSAFAYKADIGLMPMLTAGAIAVFIAISTAGYQAIKAALVDPAKTLRNE